MDDLRTTSDGVVSLSLLRGSATSRRGGQCEEGEDATSVERRIPGHPASRPEAGERCVISPSCNVPSRNQSANRVFSVFLGENNSVKLGDFGLSKIIAAHDFASTYVGTPFYMSPEICAAERYSHYSDIWSLGCIVHELASRCVPFDARNHMELIMKIKSGKRSPLPTRYSPELKEAIDRCLQTNPSYRLDTAQLLNIPNIKLARMRLQHLEERKCVQPLQQERDAALAKLSQAQKQIQQLQTEVQRLKEQGKKVEMEWHARATLAIDQRVHEQVEAKKAELLKQFGMAVEQRAENKLSLHLASLPASHGLNACDSTHVRSCTPPPGKAASFATTATTAVDTDASSLPDQALDDSALETDLTSLSLQDDLPEDDVSPLAQRNKPIRNGVRKPLGRAKTYANCNLGVEAIPSPTDVHMADPSPMPPHVAPMSIKGLSLSPRKNGQDRLSSGANLRRNIFKLGGGQNLRPRMDGDSQGETEGEASFADDDDDILDDDPADLDVEDSPSRPASGLSNASGGDPYKGFGAQPPKPRLIPRPSLARQKTMPIQLQPRTQVQRPNIFNRNKSPEREKENRPPSPHARTASAVPLVSASPKRQITSTKDPKALTPSRKAPAPPSGTSGILSKAQQPGKLLAKQMLHKNNSMQPPSPGKIQGRTLVQLQQARSQPALPTDSDYASDESETRGMAGAPKLMPSPAKWDPMLDGDEMPSPFLAKKVGGRVAVR